MRAHCVWRRAVGNAGLEADRFQMDAQYDDDADGKGGMSSSLGGPENFGSGNLPIGKSSKKKSTKKLFQDHVSGLH